jgi:hypothetical protein
VVKRKMSGFKARAAPASSRVFRYEDHIRVVAPAGPPERRAPPPPAARPERRPKSRPKQAPVPTGRRPCWLEHVRSWRASGLSRTAYCERHRLNPCAFHQWVACARQTFRRKGRPPHRDKA